ncbi:MAG: redoxin domain-containing protein [Microscillaceae bacterium]|nr:redoxin domain-containing protein [Microscillaceae bacterium]
MKLELNCSAPVFQLNDVFGRLIDLNTYRGKKVMIAFFRHAGCPFCNLRVHMLSRANEELKNLGLEMIFFFESKERVILQSSFHKDVMPIPIISDPEKTWYDAYGIETSAYKSAMSHLGSFLQTLIKAKMKGLPVHPMADGESINTIPAEFLLDQNLIIRKLLYSQSLNDRIAVDEIRAFAKA